MSNLPELVFTDSFSPNSPITKLLYRLKEYENNTHFRFFKPNKTRQNQLQWIKDAIEEKNEEEEDFHRLNRIYDRVCAIAAAIFPQPASKGYISALVTWFKSLFKRSELGNSLKQWVSQVQQNFSQAEREKNYALDLAKDHPQIKKFLSLRLQEKSRPISSNLSDIDNYRAEYRTDFFRELNAVQDCEALIRETVKKANQARKYAWSEKEKRLTAEKRLSKEEIETEMNKPVESYGYSLFSSLIERFMLRWVYLQAKQVMDIFNDSYLGKSLIALEENYQRLRAVCKSLGIESFDYPKFFLKETLSLMASQSRRTGLPLFDLLKDKVSGTLTNLARRYEENFIGDLQKSDLNKERFYLESLLHRDAQKHPETVEKYFKDLVSDNILPAQENDRTNRRCYSH